MTRSYLVSARPHTTSDTHILIQYLFNFTESKQKGVLLFYCGSGTVAGDIPQSSSESLVMGRRCRGQDELTGSIYNSSTNPNPDFA